MKKILLEFTVVDDCSIDILDNSIVFDPNVVESIGFLGDFYVDSLTTIKSSVRYSTELEPVETIERIELIPFDCEVPKLTVEEIEDIFEGTQTLGWL